MALLLCGKLGSLPRSTHPQFSAQSPGSPKPLHGHPKYKRSSGPRPRVNALDQTSETQMPQAGKHCLTGYRSSPFVCLPWFCPVSPSSAHSPWFCPQHSAPTNPLHNQTLLQSEPSVAGPCSGSLVGTALPSKWQMASCCCRTFSSNISIVGTQKKQS
jgi:hypothetical protein